MKRILSIAFVIIGILAIIFAFSAYDLETGYKESNEKYGGDAYTGIQNAAAQTARNVYYLTEAVAYSAGSILLIVGLSLVGFGVYLFMPSREEDTPSFVNSYTPPVKSSVSAAPMTWKCVCGQENSMHCGFCKTCGKPHQTKPTISASSFNADSYRPDPSGSQPAAPSNDPTTSMQKTTITAKETLLCPKCGKSQFAGAKKCFSCGTIFDQSDSL